MLGLHFLQRLGHAAALGSLAIFPLAISSHAQTEPVNNYQMGRHDFSKPSEMNLNSGTFSEAVNNAKPSQIRETTDYQRGRHDFSKPSEMNLNSGTFSEAVNNAKPSQIRETTDYQRGRHDFSRSSIKHSTYEFGDVRLTNPKKRISKSHHLQFEKHS